MTTADEFPVKLEDFIQPGDVLLYRAKGLFGWIIRIKTWHNVGHCEGYIGLHPETREHTCVASRDGKGVGIYPLRTAGLFKVCRPRGTFKLEAAMEWFDTVDGDPYGWLDLFAFIGMDTDHRGLVCSPFLAGWQRAGGINGFNGEPSRSIAPFQFDVSPSYQDFKVVDGEVVPEADFVGT